MKRKLLLSIVICIVLFVSISVAQGAPLAEIYWMSSSDGVGPGGTAEIQTYLDNMGYDARRYENTSAYYVRRTMDNDVVFAIVSHGDPGRVYANNGTQVSANIVYDEDFNYSLEARFNSGDFNGMKFAYYGTCYSARPHSVYGNLLSYTTYNLGADSALGFYNAVNHHTATYFEQRMFYWLSLGYNVYSSRTKAMGETYSLFGYFGEVNSSQIYGDTTTTITIN